MPYELASQRVFHKKMKIFFLSDLWIPFPGGAERFVYNLARELVQRGHEVRVLTSYPHAESSDGIDVVFRNVGVYKERNEGAEVVKEEIARFAPDVLFVHHFFAAQFQQEIETCGIPFVQVVHNGKRMQGASLSIYNSEYTRERAGARADDITMNPPAYPDCIASEHGDGIGFVKPIPHKGVELVYEIARRLPDRTFHVLRGEWYTIEVIQELHNIVFYQPIPLVRDFYAKCRIMLMPSKSEDAGTIPQESAMNGIPCISTDVMGLKETNAAGIRLPEDPDMWVEEIKKLDNKEYYDEVVRKQSEHLKEFKWDEKMNQIDSIIRTWQK